MALGNQGETPTGEMESQLRERVTSELGPEAVSKMFDVGESRLKPIARKLGGTGEALFTARVSLQSCFEEGRGAVLIRPSVHPMNPQPKFSMQPVSIHLEKIIEGKGQQQEVANRLWGDVHSPFMMQFLLHQLGMLKESEQGALGYEQELQQQPPEADVRRLTLGARKEIGELLETGSCLTLYIASNEKRIRAALDQGVSIDDIAKQMAIEQLNEGYKEI